MIRLALCAVVLFAWWTTAWAPAQEPVRAGAVGQSYGGNPRSESLYQGKSVRWWARRAVQARKDANARGRTIRRLQRELGSSGPSWGWLAASDCIYREERGADGWATRTGNGYYGGLQADLAFQRAYGPEYVARWGTADRWPWWAQLHMGYRGWVRRGWQPWPNTSRECGLR